MEFGTAWEVVDYIEGEIPGVEEGKWRKMVVVFKVTVDKERGKYLVEFEKEIEH